MVRKLKESEDYKIASSKMSAYSRYLTTFMTSFNLNRSDLRRYLEGKYKIVYPSRWSYSLAYVIDRKFRIRII